MLKFEVHHWVKIQHRLIVENVDMPFKVEYAAEPDPDKSFYVRRYVYVHFENEKDEIMFALRWS